MDRRNTRVEMFRRRARSGDQTGIKTLCSLTDKETFVGNLPIFLNFLSRNPPPTHLSKPDFVPEHHIDLTDPIGLVLEVLWTIAIAIQPNPTAGSTHIHTQGIMIPMQRSWPVLYSWLTFVVEFFIEYDFDVYSDPQPSTGLRALRIALYICAALLNQQILQLRHIQSTPGTGELLIRIHMYGIATSQFFARVENDVQALQAPRAAALISDGFLKDWDTYWEDVFITTLEKLVHESRISRLISRALIDFAKAVTDRPPYILMHYYFRVLSNAIMLSKPLNQELLQRHSIHHVMGIMCATGRHLSDPYSSDHMITELNAISTWFYVGQFMFFSLKYGGYTCVVSVLKAGILSVLWEVSSALEANPHGFRIYTAEKMYIWLLELIIASSIYRSVQKSLEEQLKQPPLTGIDTLKTNSRHSDLWRELKMLSLSRISTRQRLEADNTLCSNVGECTAASNFKVYRCAGCKFSFYCGRTCQKAHWRNGHRETCHQRAEDLKNGLPRIASDRDRTIIQSIIRVELWRSRNTLLNIQSNSKRGIVYITHIDYTSRMKIIRWTVADAKKNNPETDWDKLAQLYRKAQSACGDEIAVPGLVAAKIPHSRHPLYIPMVLTEPEGCLKDSDDEWDEYE